MASTSKSSQAKPEAATRQRLRKAFNRLLYAGLGLLAIFVIVFFLLPVWISNEQGRAYVLERINARMKARVAVEDWSLSWFHGTELKDVTITLPDGSRLFSCPHIQSELTLWGILWGNYDVGTTPINNMQVTLNKYSDGSTSLDALAADGNGNAALLKLLQTLRGSIQVNSSVITMNSIASRESLTYTDFAALTIASSYAPFHVQASAVAPNRILTFNATLPAPKSWPQSLTDIRMATSDIELNANNLPTLLACDLLSLDPAWRDSIGPSLDSVTFSNHAAAPNAAGNPILAIRSADGALLRLRCLIRSSADGKLVLSIANTDKDEFFALLHHSRPLALLLKHINPLFENWTAAVGFIRIESGDLHLASSQSHGSIRLTFPPMTFTQKGILAMLFSTTPSNTPLAATVQPLRVRLDNDDLQYENFTFDFAGRQRIIFNGSVSLTGDLRLLATVPTTTLLGNSTTDIPLTGTIDNPLIQLPAH